MNIRQLHTQDKPVSTFSIFKGAEGNATVIQILKGQQLKEHLTKLSDISVSTNDLQEELINLIESNFKNQQYVLIPENN